MAFGPSATQSNATPTNQSSRQSFSETEISSPLTSDTTAATAITTSMGLSQTNTMVSRPTASVDPAPPWSSPSSSMPSHSSPWPEISESSAIGSTTNGGSSITLPTSSTEIWSTIISSSAMPGSTSLVSVSTTQLTSATASGQHSPQTDRPCPSTIPSNPDASSLSTLPNTSLPSSSEISDLPSSDATDVRLNTATIAGAAIGGAALIAVIVFGIWLLRKINKKPVDDDISMVGIPRDEDLPPEMQNGIRRVRGNDDWN